MRLYQVTKLQTSKLVLLLLVQIVYKLAAVEDSGSKALRTLLIAQSEDLQQVTSVLSPCNNLLPESNNGQVALQIWPVTKGFRQYQQSCSLFVVDSKLKNNDTGCVVSSLSCTVILTSVRMEVAPLLLYVICRDNSSVALRLTCGQDVWFEGVTGFCNSFDLNIGQALMNHPLQSSRTFLDLVKSGQVLDSARVVILASDQLNRYRMSVWGQRNTRFILGIVRRCGDKDDDDAFTTPALSTGLPRKIFNKKFDPFYRDTMPLSYNGTTQSDNTRRLETYDSFNDVEQQIATTMPWQAVSSRRAPSMKPEQSEDSWGEAYRAVRNNSRTLLGRLDTDRFTGQQDPIATPRKTHLERLPKRDERWVAQNARHGTYEFTKKGSVKNPQLEFLDQGTMKAPAHHTHSLDNLYGYLPLDPRQEERTLKHKSKGENRFLVLSEANNVTAPYFLHIISRINDSLKLQPAINRDSNISTITSDVKFTVNKKSKSQSPRRQSDNGLDFILYHEKLPSTFTVPETTGGKNEASPKKPSTNHFRFSENMKENLSTQLAPFVSSPFGMHSADLGPSIASLEVEDTLPSYETNFNLTQLFPSTGFIDTFHLESQKQSKIGDGKQKATLVSDDNTLKILPVVISPTKTYIRKTETIQAIEDLNRFLDTVVTSGGLSNDVNSIVLLSSILEGVRREVVKPSLPHDLHMSESSLHLDVMQESESLSRPREDLPVGLLRSETYRSNRSAEAPEMMMSLTPSQEVTRNGLMTTKSSTYNVGDLQALLTSTSSHTSSEGNEPFISLSYYLTAENPPTLQSTEITGLTRSLTESESEAILPNGFLESEPFYFVMNEKSVPENNGNSDLKTPILFSASLSFESFRSKTHLISSAFDATQTTKLLSTPSVDEMSSAASSSSVISSALPSASHALFQPTSVQKSSTFASSGVNSSEGGGYSGNQNEGVERDTFWPVVAALVVGIPSVIVFGIAITVFHKRRAPDPQKLFNMQTLRSSHIETTDLDMTSMESPVRSVIS